jgi:16S rRNA (guanine(527)-N(7))-methyltransferase RsmG
MHPARIAELLHPFLSPSTNLCHSEPATAGEESAALSPTQLQHISTYIDLLLRWNARINLTAIRDPEEIVTRHFGESLFAARHLFATTARKASSEKNYPVPSVPPVVKPCDSAADLGSGAGFPGIPIKLWAPHLALTLIESNQKKTAFLREVIRALTLTNVNVFPGRAEQLLQQRSGPGRIGKEDPGLTSEEHDQPGRTKPRQNKRSRRKPAEGDGRPRCGPLELLPATQAGGQPQNPKPGGFDLVTLRAVEHFADVLPVAAGLVGSGGRLALLIGTSQLGQAQASLPTFAWDPPLPVPQSQSRTLLIARRS